VEHPEVYMGGGNLIFVSAYLSERMINFFYVMRNMGLDVIFYITGTSNNAPIIPEDIPVFFRTNLD